MKMRLPMLIAISVGAVTLIAYFVPFGPLEIVKSLLVDWAATLSAIALLLGILNLVLVHIEKFASFKRGWVYSIVLLLGFIFALGMGLFPPLLDMTRQANAQFNAAQTMRDLARFIFLYIQTPIETSLLAVLSIVMIMAGARLIRKRRNLSAALFVLVSLVLILGLAPLVPILGDAREWIVQVPALAGARGILLGVALGAITTGLRVIIGVDRPYGE
ncbi:MAG: hypothetical protein HZB52_10520 [Chloroflexi bacterium]|nr:hypothetical protein [Chloroflexota bacterium]